MHQPVRDNLEDHLRGFEKDYAKPVPAGMREHLDACEDCMAELKAFEDHATALRSLRAAAEPRAGFYARVMNRIDETRAKASIWSAFLEPAFARRIVYASVALVLLLGTYLVSSGMNDTAIQQSQQPTLAVTQQQDQRTADPDFENGSVTQQRDAVLVNLASYQE